MEPRVSDTLGVLDHVREQELRSQGFRGLPGGLAGAVVAHAQDTGAANKDVHFEKPQGSF